MKASRTAIARALLLTSALLAAGCVPAPDSTPAPSPSPAQTAPVPTPTATPVAAAEPKYESWMDAPRTPGDWVYTAAGGRTQAGYQTPEGAQRFSITCDTRSRTVEIARAANGSGEMPLRILTETANRTLTGTMETDPMPLLVARIQPRDPLLDAMALTKGRFAVETPNLPTLYLPAWAEVTRVIEDCR